MRFLWQSNAPWAGTGYGMQSKLMLPALAGFGHEPSMFAFYGLAGGKITYDGYDVYPNSNFNEWGNDVVKQHIEESKSDAVITLIDLFVLNKDIWGSLNVPWLAWTPIDSVGIGKELLDRMQLETCLPVAMSNFGAIQMQEHGVTPEAVIYHAVDTAVYKPKDKDECREFLGIPKDCFLVGLVMANKGDRKQYPLQLSAIKKFQDDHPDIDVRAYIHSEPTSNMGGWDLRALVEMIGLKGKVFSSNQYRTSVLPIDQDTMATIMNSFDVLMNCSAGEGFGIPIVEAQACGVPVIAQGVTAMPELVHHGYCVESSNVGLASHYGWQFAPSLDDMVYRLDCVYRGMLDRISRDAGRVWVEANCSVQTIAAQWDYLLRGVNQALDDQSEKAHEVFV